MDAGMASPAEAIKEIAPKVGTVGWHTEMTCKSFAPIVRMNSWM